MPPHRFPDSLEQLKGHSAMATIMTLAGSLTPRSRSAELLRRVAEVLASRGAVIDRATLRDVPADDLISARYDSPAMKAIAMRFARADGLVISSPVYKASCAGALKALLDLLPENTLSGKVVLPMMTGGSSAHMLALEYGLKPVLAVLGARQVLAGV